MSTLRNIEAAWARLGILWQTGPSDVSPDLERLLLQSARAISSNPRLLPLIVTWLVQYGQFVARHRLKRLVEELNDHDRAALGLFIEASVEAGATRDLLVVSDACEPIAPGEPLHEVHRSDDSLHAIAEQTASKLSKKWGVWAPDVVLKPDAIRPVGWLLDMNPDYADRIVRKGDLRASLLVTLRNDVTDGFVQSELALTRLSGATRTAVRKALRALMLEGMVEIPVERRNQRDTPIQLVGT